MPGWRIFYSKLDANRKVVPKDCASIPATGPVSELAFTLWASRRPEQYYQFFFLTFIFGVAPAYTHSIPLDLPAERGSVTFLLMLTIITFNFLISDEIPKVSHVVFLDAYMKVTFILGQTVIVENAVIGATPNGQQAEIDQYFYLSFAAVYGLVTMLAILKIFKLMDPKCFGPRVGQVVGS